MSKFTAEYEPHFRRAVIRRDDAVSGVVLEAFGAMTQDCEEAMKEVVRRFNAFPILEKAASAGLFVTETLANVGGNQEAAKYAVAIRGMMKQAGVTPE